MEPTPLRYAVIGMGNISPYHLRDIAVQPGITVVGFADAADPKAWKVDAAHTRSASGSRTWKKCCAR